MLNDYEIDGFNIIQFLKIDSKYIHFYGIENEPLFKMYPVEIDNESTLGKYSTKILNFIKKMYILKIFDIIYSSSKNYQGTKNV